MPDTALSLALQHLQAGRHADAETMLRQILIRDPLNAGADAYLGMLLLQTGRSAEAIDRLRSAIAGLPPQSGLYTLQGQAFATLQRWPEAVDAFQEASRLEPRSAEAHYNLGSALHAAGRWQEAALAFEQAIALRPEFVEALCNLGVIYRAFGRLDDAAATYEAAVRLAPDLVDVWVNLGNTRAAQEDLPAARRCYDRALSIRPDAGLAIRRALTIPAIPPSEAAIADMRQQLEADLDRLIAAGITVDDPLRDVGMANFHLTYHWHNDRPIMEKIACLYRQACPSLTWTAPHCALWEPPTNRKIRVVVVSRYLNRHTIGQLNKGWIARLDRRRFHVTVCQIGPSDDAAEAIAATADAAIPLRGSLAAMRETIAAQKPDIVFYTDIGMEPNTYFLAFARLAPVQCVTWGHPDTTGVSTIDYFVSVQDGETADSDICYSETLVRLPVMGTYFEPPTIPANLPGRAQWGFADSWRLYACPQSLFKLHPGFDPVLTRLLRDDPQGRLILLTGKVPRQQEALLRRLTTAGPDVADRILFLPYQDRQGFFNLLRSADAVLDPAYYCGGRTTYEATAVGTPMVHREGRFLRDRLTYGIYRQLGVLDTVAPDDAAYVQTALRLAGDTPWRRAVSERMIEARQEIFCDTRAVKALEAFMERAVLSVT